MKFLTRFIVSSILSLLIATITTGHTSEPIKPLPREAFTSVLMPIGEPAIKDTFKNNTIASKPQITQPSAKTQIIEKGQYTFNTSTTQSIVGPASWYCRAGQFSCSNGFPDILGIDAYAAAGPKLRAALGENNWRGHVVFVDGVQVKLIDWCQCLYKTKNEKIIDLYYDVFNITGGTVKITW